MRKKLSYLFALYTALLVFEACGCEELQFPYYDFAAIELYYSNGVEIAEATPFIVRIEDTERELLASEKPFNLGLLSAAYATQPCPRDGEYGRKISVTNVEVVSNADFDADHPAGTSLRTLFKTEIYSAQAAGFVMTPLSQIEDQNGIYSMTMENLPTLSPEHVFTITLTKGNGEVVAVTSDLITWF